MSKYWEKIEKEWFARFSAGTMLTPDDLDFGVRLNNVVRNSRLTLIQLLDKPELLRDCPNCGERTFSEFLSWLNNHRKTARKRFNMKLNHDRFYDLSFAEKMSIFRAGFECLLDRSPFAESEKRFDIFVGREYVFLFPEGGNTNDAIATIKKNVKDPNFLQFRSDKKFNALAAIKRMIDLDVIEF